jgi:SdrD B-like protein
MWLALSTAAAAQITGTVFRDFNANGVRDNSASFAEPPLAGVTITAYGAANTAVATATSNAAGAYTLAVPSGTQVRLEVTGLPPYLRPGPAGSGSATTVAFATSPAVVSFGAASSTDYCDGAPKLGVPCYANGDPLAGGSAGTTAALVSVPYNTTATSGQNTQLATGRQIGAVWGLAYSRSRKTIYAGALMMRHVGFGDADGDNVPDTGGIYAIDVSGTTPVAAAFVDFANLGISTGTNPHTGLPPNTGTQNADPLSWDAPGKIGFGDLDLSADEKTLWVVNLADRTLYGLDIASKTIVATHPLVPELTSLHGTCVDGEYRPWGLAVHDGRVYVGAVCSGENDPNPLGATGSDDLHAFVIALDPANNTFSAVFDFSLAPAVYPKQTNNTCTSAPPKWRPWLSTQPPHNNVSCNTLARYSYPQPILSDIVFESDGSMILGFADRLGFQGGEANHPVAGPGNLLEYITSGGDTVRVCKVSGTFYLEGDSSGNCPQGGTQLQTGPNGREFYFQDTGPSAHPDTAQGGLALLRGSGQVVTTAGDPIFTSSGGFWWFVNGPGPGAGTKAKAYTVYSGSGNLIGKASGLGDLELLCQPPPLQIGNRVWRDVDGDGIQDPGEPGIAGVPVQLTCAGPDGILGNADDTNSTTTTNAQGQYLFSSPGSALQPGAACRLRIASSAAALNGLMPSPLNYGANAGTTDLHDSDGNATLTSGFVTIPFTAGQAGENDHTFDFGFTALGCLRLGTPKVLCTTNGSGGYTVTLSFSNLTQGPIYHVFLVDLPTNVTVSQTYFNLSGNPVQAGGAVTLPPVTVQGAGPGPLTLTIAIHDQNLVKCCAERVTIELPRCDCGQITEEAPRCVTQPFPHFEYSFVFENLFTAAPAPHVFVTPVSPANITVSPNVFTANPPLLFGSDLSGTVQIGGSGAVPGQTICLRFSTHDAAFRECCSIEKCFRLPQGLQNLLCSTVGPGEPIDWGTISANVVWRDGRGGSGTGKPVRLTKDTGYFWFFDPDNVELVVKLLDGRPVNGNWWFFYGALSDVEYTITLTDEETGATKTYHNPAGQLASAGDTAALPGSGGAAFSAPATVPDPTIGLDTVCAGDPASLCFADGRFRVNVSWRDFAGRTGSGTAVPLTADTGAFWFFGPDNLELVLKVLDGRPVNGHWWVFYGALSNVEYTITVTDTVTGTVKTYFNPSGRFASRADTESF